MLSDAKIQEKIWLYVSLNGWESYVDLTITHTKFISLYLNEGNQIKTCYYVIPIFIQFSAFTPVRVGLVYITHVQSEKINSGNNLIVTCI